MDITPIISAFIAIFGVLLTSLFIPWLKRKLSAERYNQMQTWVRTFVLAAEQVYGAGNGREKLRYVGEMLRAKGIDVDIDNLEDEVRAMIEAAVRELGEAEVKQKISDL